MKLSGLGAPFQDCWCGSYCLLGALQMSLQTFLFRCSWHKHSHLLPLLRSRGILMHFIPLRSPDGISWGWGNTGWWVEPLAICAKSHLVIYSCDHPECHQQTLFITRTEVLPDSFVFKNTRCGRVEIWNVDHLKRGVTWRVLEWERLHPCPSWPDRKGNSRTVWTLVKGGHVEGRISLIIHVKELIPVFPGSFTVG